jgi:hypothetical protein
VGQLEVGTLRFTTSVPEAGRGSMVGARVPEAVDGLPLRANVSVPSLTDTTRAFVCSSGTTCVVGVGDSLAVHGDLLAPGWLPPGGLEVGHDARGARRRLIATVPGTYTITGLRGLGSVVPLEVTVVDERVDTPLLAEVALVRAEQDWDAGVDPGPVLDARPHLDAWPTHLRARAARLAFDHTRSGEGAPANLVARFEDLRDVNPKSQLGFGDVVAVARAYRAIERPDRAIDIWRTGLGAAFLEEAASAGYVEPIVGPLASLQVLREIADRHPAVPAVLAARFHLPERLYDMADNGLSSEVVEAGITPTDVRLMAAAWDRELVAFHPDWEAAPEAGVRLVRVLLELDADERAALWANRLAERYATDPLVDRMVYLEALARLRLTEIARTRRLLSRVETAEFPRRDGTSGPSDLKDDAFYVSARLLEATGRLDEARAAYATVAGTFQEAQTSHAALSREYLDAETVVQVAPGERVRIPVSATNVETVHMRAYRLDLRTLFLRDSGLSGARDVEVGGVSPLWTGSRSVKAGPFGREVELDVPLPKAGAYLVQLDGSGLEDAVLVVRTELELSYVDHGAHRRVTVLRGGKPVADLQVRAVAGGAIVAGRTDARGVAEVPAYAPVIAFDRDQVAFSDDAVTGAASSSRPPPPSPAPKSQLMQSIDSDMKKRRSKNRSQYDHIGSEHEDAIDLDML